MIRRIGKPLFDAPDIYIQNPLLEVGGVSDDICDNTEWQFLAYPAPKLMIHWTRLGFAALMALATAASAQSRPDFSGDWVRADSTPEQRSVASVGDAGFRTGNMGSGWGSPLTLRQQANRLVVEYAFFGTYDLQPRLSFTFALDSSESRNAVMIGHAESVLRSRAAWRGDTLVITTEYRAPAGANEAMVRQAISLASPTSLSIETTRGAVTGSAPTRTVYTKR